MNGLWLSGLDIFYFRRYEEIIEFQGHSIYVTGKTVAIVKAIENLLLYTKPSRTHRILLVSSNVGSLDEISSQLINLRKSLPSSELKEKIKVSIAPYSHFI